jgi:hypothetical protein
VQVLQYLGPLGRNIKLLPLNIENDASIQKLSGHILEKHGGFDVLITFSNASVEDASDEVNNIIASTIDSTLK